MTAKPSGTGEREQRLQEVLVAYLEAAERGRPPGLPELQARHPEFAAELAEFLTNQAQLERLAGPLRSAVEAAQARASANRTVGGGDLAGAPPPGPLTVRYFGDYELLEEIARGGMGVVFRAKQVSLNRIVALKMILKGELATEADVRRFRREAEAAANLDHPNIVPIYEVGEHDGQQYYSMKLIETVPFGRNPQGGPQAAALVAKVARAVHHAHQRGILHRDLKPSNILLDKEGEPHVADFGLAKHMPGPDRQGGDDPTRSGAIVGTPAYMAPEQARAEKSLTTSVDVYSLGAILYEWLTGRPPFRGEDPLSTLMKVVTEEPAKPRSVNPKINRDLETICLHCLEKLPGKRYPSGEALAVELDRWLRGEPIQARPAGRIERLVKWSRRHPAAGALVAVSCLALVVVVSGLAWMLDQARDRLATEQTLRRQAEDAEGITRRTTYFQRVALAQHAWRDNNLDLCRHLLDGCAPEMRGWEYHFVARLGRAEILNVLGAPEAFATFSPDEKELIVLGREGLFKAVDSQSSRELRRVGQGIEGRAAASADGRWLAGVGRDDKTHVWNARTGDLQQSLPPHDGGRARCLAFSRDGRLLATGGPRYKEYKGDQTPSSEVKVWEVDTGKLLEMFTVGTWGYPVALVFDPKGEHLAVAEVNSDVVTLWSSATKKTRVFGPHRSPTKSAGLTCVAFSNDGRRLVTGSGVQTAKVWDVKSGKEVATLAGHKATVTAAAFSPDDKQVATVGGDRTVRVWETNNGLEVAEFRGHTGSGSVFEGHVAFSPATGRFLVACADSKVAYQRNGLHGSLTEARVWDLAIGQEGRPLGTIMNYDFSPDRRQIAVLIRDSGKHRIEVRDLATGDVAGAIAVPLEDLLSSIRYLFYRTDGSLRAVVADKAGTKIWEPATGTDLCTLEGGSDTFFDRHTHVSPDRKLLAGIDAAERKLNVWDAATGRKLHVFPTEKFVCGVAFSPDSRLLAVGGFDPGEKIDLGANITGPNHLYLFDLTTGKSVYRRPVPSIAFDAHSLAFSPDGRLLALADFERTAILDARTGAEIKRLPVATRHVAFSPDGHRLATSHTHDPLVTIWETTDWQETLTLRKHGAWEGWVASTTFSPDSHWLLTVNTSGEATLWDGRPSRLYHQ